MSKLESLSARALHFVFKIGDRTKTAKFYREILGMKVLRHEEFTEGCSAACNGPYDNRWSKTMVGYGPEDTHFAVELTYNYNVLSYTNGNDFRGIYIKSKEAVERAKAANWPVTEENGVSVVRAPDGYKFYLINEPQPADTDPVQKVSLASTNLTETIEYWHKTLKMKIYEQDDVKKRAVFGFADNQAKLEFQEIGEPLDHGEAYGRIAFSVPRDDLDKIDYTIKNSSNPKYVIFKPLMVLDTPGKASVKVIILKDPDEHEICFVEDENFRVLSQVDPESNAELDKYIKKDEARKEKGLANKTAEVK